jgi:hypothetical protein
LIQEICFIFFFIKNICSLYAGVTRQWQGVRCRNFPPIVFLGGRPKFL